MGRPGVLQGRRVVVWAGQGGCRDGKVVLCASPPWQGWMDGWMQPVLARHLCLLACKGPAPVFACMQGPGF